MTSNNSSWAAGSHQQLHSQHQVQDHIVSLVQGQERLEEAMSALQRKVDHLPQALMGTFFGTTASGDSPGQIVKSVPEGTRELGFGIGSPVQAPQTSEDHESSVPIAHEHPSIGILSPHARSRRTFMPHADFVEHATLMQQNLPEIARSWQAIIEKNNSLSLSSRSHNYSGQGNGNAVNQHAPMFPIHPLATVPTIIDCLSAIILLADAALIPVVIAWDIPSRGWLRQLAIFMLVFWSIDMALKFCTGFIKGAAVVLNWRTVVMRYLRRGFLFDVSLILIDSIDLASSFATDSGNSSGAFRAIRLLRFAKMTRMIRICTRMNSSIGVQRIDAALSSWVVRTFGAFSSAARCITLGGILMRLMLAVLCLSHMLACTWYFLLHNATSSDDDSWLQWMAQRTNLEMYLYGVYWSLSTIFAGASFLPPVAVWEIVYATTLLLVGALFITSITSTLAATLIEAQQSRVELKKQLGYLSGFLEQEGLSGIVLMAVHEDYVTNMTSSNGRITEADVEEQLSVLSADVRDLVRAARFSSSFWRVDIFRLAQPLCVDFIQEMCTAASFTMKQPGEELFHTNQIILHAMLLSNGKARYNHKGLQPSSSVATLAATTSHVVKNSWICEVALLLTWRSLGTLEPEGACELLYLPADIFIKSVCANQALLAVVSSYAAHLCEEATSRGEVTDLGGSIDHDMIITSMPSIVREELVSGPVLEFVRQQQQGTISGFLPLFRGKALSDLEEEMKHGKCHLSIAKDGTVQRVVKMVVLHLEDERGFVCVQLARSKDASSNSNFEAKFEMPGQKLEEGSTPMDAARKILQSFGEATDSIEILPEETTAITECEQSGSYGINTKYVKIVVRAMLNGTILTELGSATTLTASAFSGFLLTTPLPMWWSGTGSTKPPAVEPAGGIFSIKSKDTGQTMILKWYDMDEIELHMENKAAEVAAIKAWLAQVQPSQLTVMSQWSFATGVSRLDAGIAAMPHVPQLDGLEEERALEEGGEGGTASAQLPAATGPATDGWVVEVL